ncbi:dihydroxyacetone kinase subunit DhaL [Actinomadura madurae]|uniref:Dihydroxyacetone kinase DhaL subunit n=1 Tax=Actinomadura madurae TaxID=1993 RepID=A0A1I5T0R6_9ACTN|nr:dihydroxyacetone kinase subunit DhaL [Actinomadura madurae]SFP76036.1 dihydroxyacetone kinase DhaL subunit [Actinomadura madurae]SPT59667.1 PTS-dependent dihydroxyacetone kinase, ADP-binding subunit dhaL [Actinomadura madurae]
MNAEDLASWIRHAAELVAADAGRLTRLDAAIGDGDHGHNLDRGFRAAVEALPDDTTPAKVLIAAGRAIVSKTGGASGPLYGTALRRAGKALGNTEDVDAAALGAALKAALEGVQDLGKAVEGDKTMVDALVPAVAAYEAALSGGSGLAACVRAAADAAAEGADDTVPMRARKGRASYLGARSEGHLDPGASSTALLLRALADVAGEE